MTTPPPRPAPPGPEDPSPGSAADAGALLRVRLAGLAVLAVLAVAGLLWAKWLPYGGKVEGLATSRHWSGSAIFGASGAPGSPPSLAGAVEFTRAYAAAVWKAAVVAVVLAAALEALVPRSWLLRPLSRPGALRQGVTGGLLAMPSMMCTCCTAPVTIGLRRRGAPVAASVAYWLGNPVLNPAVLVFLALCLPGELLALRVLVGVPLVLGAAVLASRLAAGRPADPSGLVPVTDEPTGGRQIAARFGRSLARYLVVVVPEYLVVVLLTGAVSAWLSDWTGLGSLAGPLAILVVSVVGALLVIPTGGEIPVVAGLAGAGLATGSAAALLITLPALSLPSVVMVARSLTWRVTLAVTGLVVLAGVAAGLVARVVG
ncbi:permease [Phycicoccus endophyticus]|uniref:Permease n=1 Tax=Phycicoccus endophyticus TaxID=1690220 RepID=A0A7G9R4R6_9MICO|nr:permease [Phycicoccus endophyticus]NHI18508.1 permease [Phycicoccus endophyticus]QNN50591.1 permease [Phycicoccus endophyticus]GGL23199.1 hypothetical protein GCM10012283_01640 [Phycicoccus endophyticus]